MMRARRERVSTTVRHAAVLRRVVTVVDSGHQALA